MKSVAKVLCFSYLCKKYCLFFLIGILISCKYEYSFTYCCLEAYFIWTCFEK